MNQMRGSLLGCLLALIGIQPAAPQEAGRTGTVIAAADLAPTGRLADQPAPGK